VKFWPFFFFSGNPELDWGNSIKKQGFLGGANLWVIGQPHLYDFPVLFLCQKAEKFKPHGKSLFAKSAQKIHVFDTFFE